MQDTERSESPRRLPGILTVAVLVLPGTACVADCEDKPIVGRWIEVGEVWAWPSLLAVSETCQYRLDTYLAGMYGPVYGNSVDTGNLGAWKDEEWLSMGSDVFEDSYFYDDSLSLRGDDVTFNGDSTEVREGVFGLSTFYHIKPETRHGFRTSMNVLDADTRGR